MKVRLFAIAALSAVAFVPAVSAQLQLRVQPQTTVPNVIVDIKVTITDSKIVLSRHSAPRGTNARFIIRNLGTKPHAFRLGAAAPGTGQAIGFTRVVNPGTKQIYLLFLNYRGTIPYSGGLPADQSKPGMKGTFSIGEPDPGSVTN